MSGHIIRPLFVFEKFLTHKQHRNTRRRQNQSSGHARPASRPPGVRVRRIGDTSYTIHPAGVVGALWTHHQIVVLDALHAAPHVLKVRGSELLTESGHRKLIVIGISRQLEDLSNSLAQPVGQRSVKSSTSVGHLFYHPGIDLPVFGMLDRTRAFCPQRAREGLTEVPPSSVSIAVDDANFV